MPLAAVDCHESKMMDVVSLGQFIFDAGLIRSYAKFCIGFQMCSVCNHGGILNTSRQEIEALQTNVDSLQKQVHIIIFTYLLYISLLLCLCRALELLLESYPDWPAILLLLCEYISLFKMQQSVYVTVSLVVQ